LRDVVGLYLDPPAHAIVLSVDEKSQIQALDRTQPEISVTLKPGEGAEVKLTMTKGAKATYSWTANGAVVNFDTHGDGGGENISYEKGRGVAEDEGVLEAAFDGNHGWFWRNRSDTDVTVTLRERVLQRDQKNDVAALDRGLAIGEASTPIQQLYSQESPQPASSARSRSGIINAKSSAWDDRLHRP
jgi:hypothetical protein